MTGTVSLQISGPLARVILSHPGKFNAMSRVMWLELRSAFTAIQQEPGIRCVLVSGEGGHFCSGGDISEYADFRFTEHSLSNFHENEVWGGLQAMLDCDVPTVAQISGNCMGAGLEISSCCDMRVAGESARFGAPIAKLGFPMAPREAALVMSAVGGLTAREMLLSAAVLDAPEMKRRGFLNAVMADADLATTVQLQVERIVSLAPTAARLNKKTLRALTGAAHGPAQLVANAYAYADTSEHREGIAAFTEKRPAHFAN
ncbi:MAG: enoyl-CoA hydratase-related protein [Pseudomonadota bacterium]